MSHVKHRRPTPLGSSIFRPSGSTDNRQRRRHRACTNYAPTRTSTTMTSTPRSRRRQMRAITTSGFSLTLPPKESLLITDRCMVLPTVAVSTARVRWPSAGQTEADHRGAPSRFPYSSLIRQARVAGRRPIRLALGRMQFRESTLTRNMIPSSFALDGNSAS